ncbi:MAG: hypothetical protein HND52_20430 [Ignavibacteriae bacterium]|nr:hypothetical protein [Ignavibacteriota bacterium]NOH00339.1 hypothetical protein [Ignavibacteriota bacterium]
MSKLNRIENKLIKLIPLNFRKSIYFRNFISDMHAHFLSSAEKKILEYMKSLNVKDTILFTGIPKSGNTWARFIIFNYFNILNNNAEKTLTYVELDECQPHELQYPKTCFKPYKQGFPVFVRAHYPYSKIFDSFDKIIYIYRNPLDTLISSYHFFGNRTVPFAHYNVPDTEREKYSDIDYFVLAELPRWIYHYIKTVPKSDVVLCYEEMKQDSFEVILDAFKKLEFPIDENILKKSIEISSFDSIKKMSEETNQSSVIAFNKEAEKKFKGTHTRSGKTKQYLEELDEQTISKAKQLLKKSDIPIEI